ncbi:hypothetical protein HDU93_002217 [Gonapodya sp. JEL0774]|nr:hypothetical protein HDU93_002217 [Gonapodya sp. JEL0774]
MTTSPLAAPPELQFINSTPLEFAELGRAPSARRKRIKTTEQQQARLNELFEIDGNPDKKQRQKVAQELDLTVRAVAAWFQNKRAISSKGRDGAKFKEEDEEEDEDSMNVDPGNLSPPSAPPIAASPSASASPEPTTLSISHPSSTFSVKPSTTPSSPAIPLPRRRSTQHILGVSTPTVSTPPDEHSWAADPAPSGSVTPAGTPNTSRSGTPGRVAPSSSLKRPPPLSGADSVDALHAHLVSRASSGTIGAGSTTPGASSPYSIATPLPSPARPAVVPSPTRPHKVPKSPQVLLSRSLRRATAGGTPVHPSSAGFTALDGLANPPPSPAEMLTGKMAMATLSTHVPLVDGGGGVVGAGGGITRHQYHGEGRPSQGQLQQQQPQGVSVPAFGFVPAGVGVNAGVAAFARPPPPQRSGSGILTGAGAAQQQGQMGFLPLQSQQMSFVPQHGQAMGFVPAPQGQQMGFVQVPVPQPGQIVLTPQGPMVWARSSGQQGQENTLQEAGQPSQQASTPTATPGTPGTTPQPSPQLPQSQMQPPQISQQVPQPQMFAMTPSGQIIAVAGQPVSGGVGAQVMALPQHQSGHHLGYATINGQLVTIAGPPGASLVQGPSGEMVMLTGGQVQLPQQQHHTMVVDAAGNIVGLAPALSQGQPQGSLGIVHGNAQTAANLSASQSSPSGVQAATGSVAPQFVTPQQVQLTQGVVGLPQGSMQQQGVVGVALQGAVGLPGGRHQVLMSDGNGGYMIIDSSQQFVANHHHQQSQYVLLKGAADSSFQHSLLGIQASAASPQVLNASPAAIQPPSASEKVASTPVGSPPSAAVMSPVASPAQQSRVLQRTSSRSNILGGAGAARTASPSGSQKRNSAALGLSSSQTQRNLLLSRAVSNPDSLAIFGNDVTGQQTRNPGRGDPMEREEATVEALDDGGVAKAAESALDVNSSTLAVDPSNPSFLAFGSIEPLFGDDYRWTPDETGDLVPRESPQSHSTETVFETRSDKVSAGFDIMTSTQPGNRDVMISQSLAFTDGLANSAGVASSGNFSTIWTESYLSAGLALQQQQRADELGLNDMVFESGQMNSDWGSDMDYIDFDGNERKSLDISPDGTWMKPATRATNGGD